MCKFVDITGQRFGRWTVLEYVGKSKWLCKCDCGTIKSVSGCGLKNGKSASCGCLQKEKAREMMKGKTGEQHPTYGRCGELNPFYGKHHSEETRQKISESRKGKCCGEENPFYGHIYSDEDKKRLSEKLSGKNSPCYNPSLTDEDRKNRRFSPKYKQWAKDVKEQANYTCDCCGRKNGGHLVSHHLNCHSKYKEQRYDINNGVCLCESCHKEFHSYMGGYKVKCTAEDYYKWKQLKQEEFDSKTEDVA